MKKEPVTTDTRISYIDAENHLVVFDRTGHCAQCVRCLVSQSGVCPFGGPFDEHYRLDLSSFITVRDRSEVKL